MNISLNSNRLLRGMTALCAIIVAAVVITVGTVVVVKLIKAFKRLDGRPTRYNTNLLDEVSIPAYGTADVKIAVQKFTMEWLEFPDAISATPKSHGETPVSPLVMLRIDTTTGLIHLMMGSDAGWISTNIGALFPLDADGFPITFTPPEQVAVGTPVTISRSTNMVQWTDIGTVYVIPSPPEDPRWLYFRDGDSPPGSAFYRARR